MKPNLLNKPLIPYGWLRALIFLALYMGVIFSVGVIIYLLQKQSGTATANTEGGIYYFAYLINAIVSFGMVWLFRKIVDRQRFESTGFAISKNGSHAGAGFFTGIFILCTGACILFFSKNLQWTDISFSPTDLFISFGLMVIVAFYEELVFRGYILNNLLESLPKWPALLVSAFVFALVHITNPSFSAVGAVNLLLAGILLGMNYIYTKNLWFSIMLHFTWNFFQGPILGFEVSGTTLKSLFQHQVNGSELLTGGKFGFEGSLVATLLLVPAIVAFAWVYQKKYRQPAEPVSTIGIA